MRGAMLKTLGQFGMVDGEFNLIPPLCETDKEDKNPILFLVLVFNRCHVLRCFVMHAMVPITGRIPKEDRDHHHSQKKLIKSSTGRL